MFITPSQLFTVHKEIQGHHITISTIAHETTKNKSSAAGVEGPSPFESECRLNHEQQEAQGGGEMYEPVKASQGHASPFGARANRVDGFSISI
jgi:hypothetical protein